MIWQSALAAIVAVLAVLAARSFTPLSAPDNRYYSSADQIGDIWLHWEAPFLSGSGYGSEAFAYVDALDKVLPNRLSIAHHGDSVNMRFIRGLPYRDQQLLLKLLHTEPSVHNHISVCHSEPGAWHPALYETSICPHPSAAYKIGRTMFETDRIPSGWAERMEKMDEIWVPSHWQLEIFVENGVNRSKIHIIPEAVDTDFFNPARVKSPRHVASEGKFVFLSIFKFEKRKAWEVLLEGFFNEFTRSDPVTLVVLTHEYHPSEKNNPTDRLAHFKSEYLATTGREESDLPELILLGSHISQTDLPALYAGANCFVLPSRGEGWGRPHCEAMSMGLPIIATNWSGTTEFMNEANSFPLPIDGLELVGEGPFATHMWATPSISHLQRLMRLVFTDRALAISRGKQAQEDMRKKYRPALVVKSIVERLREISKKLAAVENAY